MSKCTFWLLDINFEVEDHRPELWMWGIDDEGKRVLIIDRNFPSYFFLVLDSREDPNAVLERVRQRKDEVAFITDLELTRRRLFGEPVQAVKVSCQDPELGPKYSRLLSKVKGVKKCLEDDIRYSMRYLIDNHVTPCSWHEVNIREAQSKSGVRIDKVYIAGSAPKRIEREDSPPLRVLSFFPVCYGAKGPPKPERDPVVIIATVTSTGEKEKFAASDHDDNYLIESFVEYVSEFDPDIIVGYETNQRHWQYLIDRAKKLGLRFLVDRANTLPHRSVYGHISITGRASMDMADFADELPEVKIKTLENVADFLEVKSLDEQMTIDEVDFAGFWDDTEKRQGLIRFAMEKAELILGVFDKMLDYATALSRLVGLPLDHIGKAAVGFRIEWYLIREAHKIDELVPARIGRPYIPYAGGMVLKPKPGIHEDIAVLDFKSMYPNIMIDKNVSPDTYIHPNHNRLQV